ncbi:hypothetical protein CBR_g54968 [Chara braunii]|uniref:PsbP C-terminal domain-containing protein n=1 Tax=Chara braunii TaxID=69332 RepID=A0A388K7J1_CHABU|nr:hypothetical protein CBR_g54968 [Chara braunii]|eukprot:GBG65989.1 hypothetical protein CBR_g54968 [Chara braunii]
MGMRHVAVAGGGCSTTAQCSGINGIKIISSPPRVAQGHVSIKEQAGVRSAAAAGASVVAVNCRRSAPPLPFPPAPVCPYSQKITTNRGRAAVVAGCALSSSHNQAQDSNSNGRQAVAQQELREGGSRRTADVTHGLREEICATAAATDLPQERSARGVAQSVLGVTQRGGTGVAHHLQEENGRGVVSKIGVGIGALLLSLALQGVPAIAQSRAATAALDYSYPQSRSGWDLSELAERGALTSDLRVAEDEEVEEDLSLLGAKYFSMHDLVRIYGYGAGLDDPDIYLVPRKDDVNENSSTRMVMTTTSSSMMTNPNEMEHSAAGGQAFLLADANVGGGEDLSGLLRFEDRRDGYAFNYPDDWVEVRGAGADIFYRSAFDPDENLFVSISSPSSSNYQSISDLGTPEEAGKRFLKQYLTELMSTRLGVRRESKLLSTRQRTTPDGQQFYEIEANVKSFAATNQLAINPEERVPYMEWDRRYLSVLGVANSRLYELRLQVPEKSIPTEEARLRRVMDSFELQQLSTRTKD